LDYFDFSVFLDMGWKSLNIFNNVTTYFSIFCPLFIEFFLSIISLSIKDMKELH